MVRAIESSRPGWRLGYRAEFREYSYYALLYHTLYEMKRAAEFKRPDRALAALNVWSESYAIRALIDTQIGPLIVVDAGKCQVNDDSVFQSPPLTVVQSTLLAEPPVARPLITEALRGVIVSGFEHYVRRNLAVVVLMDERPGDGTTNSYSLTAFPGTVYTDYTPHAVRLGECLLHESAHCWLNERLGAAAEDLPLEPMVFSPWKNTMRPPFGIVHAVLAFSVLTQYFRYFARQEDTSPEMRDYCQKRMETEIRILKDVRPSVRSLLRLLKNKDIAVTVDSELELALG
jgi:hypothetical protein